MLSSFCSIKGGNIHWSTKGSEESGAHLSGESIVIHIHKKQDEFPLACRLYTIEKVMAGYAVE